VFHTQTPRQMSFLGPPQGQAERSGVPYTHAGAQPLRKDLFPAISLASSTSIPSSIYHTGAK